MFCALVVEDDQKLNSLYCSFLEKQGYVALGAHGANQAMVLLEQNRVDIVLCDIMMPEVDGFMLIHAIRKLDADLPIIAMTALGDYSSKQRAFSLEVDDYIVKPVDLNELILRISALLRRAHAVSKQRIVIGDAVLDREQLTVVEKDQSAVLPPKEFMILFKLCSSVGRVFTRRDIMNDVWGMDTGSGERTVDVHIKRLRERFAASESFSIDTVRGIGYKVTAKR